MSVDIRISDCIVLFWQCERREDVSRLVLAAQYRLETEAVVLQVASS